MSFVWYLAMMVISIAHLIHAVNVSYLKVRELCLPPSAFDTLLLSSFLGLELLFCLFSYCTLINLAKMTKRLPLKQSTTLMFLNLY